MTTVEIESALWLSIHAWDVAGGISPYYPAWNKGRRSLRQDQTALEPIVDGSSSAWQRALDQQGLVGHDRADYSAFCLLHGYVIIQLAIKGRKLSPKALDRVSVCEAAKTVLGTFREQGMNFEQWKKWLANALGEKR